MEAQTAFAPGAWDDERLDEVTLHAVEVGRLVMLIDEAKRHQEQAGPQGAATPDLAIDIKLLDLEFAGILS